jgi:signal transduction histidine kinase
MNRNWLRFVAIVLAPVVLVVQGLAIFHEATWKVVSHEVNLGFEKQSLKIEKISAIGQQRGFKIGDTLVQVAGQPVSSVLEYRAVISAQIVGDEVEFVVERNGERLTALAPIEHRPLSAPFFLRNLVGFLFLLMGILVVLQNPTATAARIFFFTTLALGLYFPLQQAELVALVYISGFALTLIPGLAIHFFLTFPEERWLARSRWWFLIYLPSLVLMVLTTVAFSEAVRNGTGIYYAPFYWMMSNINFAYLGLSGVVGLASLGYSYTTTTSPLVKRQIQWIMWGLAFAVAANVTDIVLTFAGVRGYDTSTPLLIGTLPLPIAFGFAILRYRLLDIDVVINRSVVYGLLTAALAALYLLLITLLSTALGTAIGSGGYTTIVFVSALLIGILVNPLRARIQALIDRLFFRQQLNYQRALVDWSQELSTSLRFSHLGQLLLKRVPQEMSITQAWLLVLNKEETTFEPLHAPDDDPPARSSTLALSLPAPSSLVTSLNKPGQILLLHGEESEEQQTDLQLPPGWREAGVRVALPLVSGGTASPGSGQGLVAIYLLGGKRSRDIYQSHELDLLRTLCNQAAVAIANARLYEEIHAFSQELEEKVKERTEELRDFVSAVYHELVTPIIAIRGYTDLLVDGRAGGLNDKQTGYLTTVRRNTQRLTRLVADLADVSRIDDGRLTLHLESVVLQEAITETLEGLSGAINEKELEVDVAVSPEAGVVRGDPQRVVQILTNLVGNASRYTPVGGKIAIASSPLDGFVQITVQDTGIGIHKEELDRIFERFYRSDDPLVRDQTGTGLGLAITKSLVELHGGQIWVESKVGEGSTFGFTLPQAEEAADES